MGLNPGKGSTSLSAQQMVSPIKAIKHGSTLELEETMYHIRKRTFFRVLHVTNDIPAYHHEYHFSPAESQVCVTWLVTYPT